MLPDSRKLDLRPVRDGAGRGQRPDGSALRAPMTLMASYGQSMKEVERRALWAYLQSLPPVNKSVPTP